MMGIDKGLRSALWGACDKGKFQGKRTETSSIVQEESEMTKGETAIFMDAPTSREG